MPVLENIVGSKESEHFTKQDNPSIVIDYLLATSTHGLRSVGRAYSKRNRMFWLLIFTIATGLMFYFVISAILQYFAYPTQTKVDINLDLSMAFPAVTICSGNPNRYDKTNISLVNFFYRLNSPNTTFNQSELDNLLLPLYIDLFNRNQIEEWQSLGFKMSDMLLSCAYNGIDCSNAFIPSISSALGNCYTFNWKTSTDFVTLTNISSTFVLKEGLGMSFYIPTEIYFPATWADAGLVVLLHDNDELPLPNENGLYLKPGASHLIVYRKSVTTFLPHPYTQCTSEVADDMRSLYQTTFINQTASTAVAYSESVCRILCEQAYIYSQCSCIIPVPFFLRKVYTLDNNLINANTCSMLTNEAACAFTAQQKFSASNHLQDLWCVRCNPQCTHTYFDAVPSAQGAPSEADMEFWAEALVNGSNITNTTSTLLPNDFAQRFDYYFERNYLKLFIACGSKYVTEYKQEAKTSLIDTFAAIGGQTGL
ncbi:unnamed protein product [Adineta steineri]|uniref:Uncharacterized protein n=1 Tax=Adineta steineri TaxID=433720 RepID=A0A813WFL7_9BILA|nr:unnamed protein product [Adineta steineri]